MSARIHTTTFLRKHRVTGSLVHSETKRAVTRTSMVTSYVMLGREGIPCVTGCVNFTRNFICLWVLQFLGRGRSRRDTTSLETFIG